jgi:hypothetical protein
MIKSVIELAKNGFVVVDAEQVEQVRVMAHRVGVCACGGALVERGGGGFDKVLYTEQPVPEWVALVEALERDKWAEIAQVERDDFMRVCEGLGMVVHGGAIVERGGRLMQGYYVEQ